MYGLNCESRIFDQILYEVDIVALIFITQKCIVRIIMKAKPKDYGKKNFSKLGILTLYSQYIFFHFLCLL
jgi:hypothetical protein